jgi:protein required for attachment to host cells
MIKVLVANRGQADLYETSELGSTLTRVKTFTNVAAQPHEKEPADDRPGGRVLNRVAGVRQSQGRRHEIRDRASEKFMRQIAASMSAEAGDCAGLVLVGAPRLVNRLQDALPKSAQAKLIGVIPRDLAHRTAPEIRRCLRTAVREGAVGA